MSSKKRSLGRNLEALLGGGRSTQAEVLDAEPVRTRSAAIPSPTKAQPTAYHFISVEQLQPGQYQPRREMDPDALEALATSIKAQGVLQPILIRALDRKRQSFEIIAGERRWRAAQLAGLTQVPVIERKMNDEEAMAIGLIENIQRENLNPIEEALAFDRLCKEFKLTHQEIGELTGRSRSAISNLLRLLTLEQSVKLHLEKNALDMGHARALLPLSKSEQKKLAEQIIEKGLSVRETEELVKKHQSVDLYDEDGGEVETEGGRVLDPDVLRLQERLTRVLATPVKLAHRPNGRGKFVVKYHSIQELERLLACFETAH